MDDGATPVEHGGAPVPAPFSKIYKFSTTLLCLMSAFQHRNFNFFETSEAFVKFDVLTCSPYFALIPTSETPKFAFFRAHTSNIACLEKAPKVRFFVNIQISSKIELRVV